MSSTKRQQGRSGQLVTGVDRVTGQGGQGGQGHCGTEWAVVSGQWPMASGQRVVTDVFYSTSV